MPKNQKLYLSLKHLVQQTAVWFLRSAAALAEPIKEGDEMEYTVLEIYEKVCVVKPIEQRLFFHRLNDTVMELLALYPKKHVLLDGNDWTRVNSLEGILNIRDLFVPAVVDNILFLSDAGEVYKSEFLRKAENADKRCRAGDGSIKIMKRGDW